MHSDVTPAVHPVPIVQLRPTQITVGMREVELKRRELQAMNSDRAGLFLGRHFVPAVLGPKGRYHIVDHHHLVRALHEEGFPDILVTVICDLSGLDKDAFLTVMDNRAWLHPFDARGRRKGYGKLPRTVGALVDDPYRSLAGEVRRQGGYAKDTTPFAEFLWADFFRRRIAAADLEEDFERSAREALRLARESAAGYLPGWCGPEDE